MDRIPPYFKPPELNAVYDIVLAEVVPLPVIVFHASIPSILHEDARQTACGQLVCYLDCLKRRSGTWLIVRRFVCRGNREIVKIYTACYGIWLIVVD